MPEPLKVERAYLEAVIWDPNQKEWQPKSPQSKGGGAAGGAAGNTSDRLNVQFNPETLTVTYTNQISGGDQNGGAASQYVGKGSTRLGLDLWFDTTVPLREGEEPTYADVRSLTTKVAQFMRLSWNSQQRVPPAARFHWGAFLFVGIMESLTEKLEYFSIDGVPLRASLAISLTSQEVQIQPAGGPAAAGQAAVGPGQSPLQPARSDRSLQQTLAALGQAAWQGVARANGIENPRFPSPGQMIDPSAGRRKGG